jgi:hypothetical protein
LPRGPEKTVHLLETKPRVTQLNTAVDINSIPAAEDSLH